jgi:hypothetical protein
MNAATKQKKWMIVGVALVRIVSASSAYSQEKQDQQIAPAVGKIVNAGQSVSAVQTVQAVQTKHDSLTLSEIKAGAIRQFKIKVDTDSTTGSQFAQIHGTVFQTCLNEAPGFKIEHRVNSNKKIIGFDLRDKGDKLRNCQNSNRDKACSSDKDSPLVCVPLTQIKNSRIELDGLAGADLVIVHDNLEASDEDEKIVAERTGVSFKSAQELNFEALEAAGRAETARQLEEKEEFNRLAGNVKHCRAGNIEVAEEALLTINSLYPHLAAESGISLAKYEKEIKVDGLSKMECEVRGQSAKGKCGKFTLVKDRSGLLEEADKLLGSDTEDSEAWVAQNKDVVESDKLIEKRVVDLTKALINRIVSPDENVSDDENKDKESEDSNQLTEEHFDKAAEIADRLDKNVNLSAANKKRVVAWKEDLRLLKLSYAARNGLSKSSNKIQAEQNRLMKQAQKLCSNSSIRNEKAQEAKAQACAEVKERLQVVSQIAQSAQMTDIRNYQMAQMQQQRMTQMATARYYQEQQQFQRELQMMNMNMSGNMSGMSNFGISPGMSPVMGSQMYGLGMNNPSMIPGTGTIGNPYAGANLGGVSNNDWSVTGYFNPYNLK